MLMELLTQSGDRIISGQYKSHGNQVHLKIDVLDPNDFQRYGCLSNTGPGTCHSHMHQVTGTLLCSPDSKTATLNISLGAICSDANQWAVASPPRSAEPAKSAWSPSEPSLLKEGIPYSVYSTPVSPPSMPQDVPPPLLDFAQGLLMTEIQNMDLDRVAFDLKDTLAGQIQYSDSPPVSLPAPLPSPQGPSHFSAGPDPTNPLVNKPFQVNLSALPFAAKSPPSMPGLPSSPTATPCLLKPKLERTDSICSDYTPLKDEYLTYTEELCGGGLTELDDTDHSGAPGSPLLFSPSHHSSIHNPSQQLSEKQGNLFVKSFESRHQTSSAQNEAFDSLFSSSSGSSPKSSSSPALFCNGPTAFSLSLQPSPKPYLLSHAESPPLSGSPCSSIGSAELQDTPLTLLASPKSRNRRNSSFDETKPHMCPQCAARFTTKSNLGQHAKIHLAVKPFICEICHHGFTRAAHYESHVAKHKGLKTHKCDQCGEAFARMDNLLRHSARHKHGKIFECTLCGKGFHRKDKLLEHEKVHTETSHPCDKCAKTFHTIDALKHHLPLHEDSSKTQCKECCKFITLKSMNKHMASFHKESQVMRTMSDRDNNNRRSKSRSKKDLDKPIGCNYHGCKKTFPTPAKLRLHIGKFHAAERRLEMPLHMMTAPDHSAAMLTFGKPVPGGEAVGTQRFFEESQHKFQSSPSSDGLPSQLVPEIENNYVNSSPEDISDFGQSKELPSMAGNQFGNGPPVIHIPEFDNLHPSKMDERNEISSAAINAILFA